MVNYYCKYCGNSLNSDQLFCPNCGQKNEAYLDPTDITSDSQSLYYSTQEQPVTENPKSKKKLIIILSAVIAGIALIVVAIIVGINISKSNRYDEALSLMQQDKKQEAYEIFEGLGDYKESETYALNLNNEICYDKAMDYLRQGNGAQARAELEKTKNYKEADDLLAYAKSTNDEVSDDAYFVGAYILAWITTDTFAEEMGNKMKKTVEANSINIKKTSYKEIESAIFVESYVREIVDWIEAIPENGGDDSLFKEFIMCVYKMKMDEIYGKYVEDNGYKSSTLYVYASDYLVNEVLGSSISHSEISDLNYMCNLYSSALIKGEKPLDDIDAIKTFASITMFSDVDK